VSVLAIYAGVILLVALTGGLTALAAYIVWRRGYAQGWRRARAQPPACPKCGYNMSGLRQCRCPECGAEFDLDEVWRTPIHAKKNS
jgi:uncharacterized paraquat-inducible protein A